MRLISCLSLFLLISSAQAADSFSIAHHQFQAGATQLALARVLRDQPATPDIAGWYDWESLRLTLLSASDKPAEIVARNRLYPMQSPRDFMQKALGHNAWAQLELKQGAVARSLLARLLWQFDLNPADHQWARRLVIRSYLVENKADEAYRAMLRYQQDFQPLPKEVASEFVQGLLKENRVTEAMTWLADLDLNAPETLSLQLKAGLAQPDAVIAQARQWLQTRPNPGYAEVIAEAAVMLRDERLLIEGLERGLALDTQLKTPGERADKLWRAYLHEAGRIGNRAQLLQGDDVSWFELALRTEPSDALSARALYAYVAQHSPSSGVRETALSRLLTSLVALPAEGVAIQLFQHAPWNKEKLSSTALGRLVQRGAENFPPQGVRSLYLVAGRVLEAQQDTVGAADFYVQAVLLSDLREPDVLATQALQMAMAAMERAGHKQDALQFYQRVVTQKAPPKQAVPEKSGKRKK